MYLVRHLPATCHLTPFQIPALLVTVWACSADPLIVIIIHHCFISEGNQIRGVTIDMRCFDLNLSQHGQICDKCSEGQICGGSLQRNIAVFLFKNTLCLFISSSSSPHIRIQ